jgi:hypothetical protein
MPLSEANKQESKSIEDLIAQLDAPQDQQHNNNDALGRKILKGKRASSNNNGNSPNMATSAPAQSFMKQASFNGLNSEPVLSKNLITSKKYTKHSNSRTALKAQPKKNGAGGKYTWGAPGCELVDYLDTKDPNYDSGEDGGNVVMVCLENSDGTLGSKRQTQSGRNNVDYADNEELKELDGEDLEAEIKPVILEYFQNGDTIEVIDHLKCYNFSKLKPQLIAYLGIIIDFFLFQCRDSNQCYFVLSSTRLGT